MTAASRNSPPAILIGNSFPLSLVRRRVVIEPCSLEAFHAAAADAELFSFWGHANTIQAATATLGLDVSPREARPALTLSDDRRPTLYGRVFDECWILSPVYTENFRPRVGEEVAASRIADWQVLRMRWEE